MTIETVALLLISASALSMLCMMLNRLFLGRGMGKEFLKNGVVIVLCPLIAGLTMLGLMPPSVLAVVLGTIVGAAFIGKQGE